MIVVKVELHSAITHKVTELARMHIANVGGSKTHGDYDAYVLRKPKFHGLFRRTEVRRHERLRLPVWTLVAKALANMGYLPESYAPLVKCPACLHDAERPYDEQCSQELCPAKSQLTNHSILVSKT